MNLGNSVALVTGGASGLGLATVYALLQHDMQVVIVDLPTSAGEDVTSELGHRVRFAAADVADVGAVKSALDVAESLGTLRVVVNSAGVGDYVPLLSENGPFPLDNFVRVLNVNLVGTFNVLRLGAERMAKNDPFGEERGVIRVEGRWSMEEIGARAEIGRYCAEAGGDLRLPVVRILGHADIGEVLGPGETPHHGQAFGESSGHFCLERMVALDSVLSTDHIEVEVLGIGPQRLANSRSVEPPEFRPWQFDAGGNRRGGVGTRVEKSPERQVFRIELILRLLPGQQFIADGRVIAGAKHRI